MSRQVLALSNLGAIAAAGSFEQAAVVKRPSPAPTLLAAVASLTSGMGSPFKLKEPSSGKRCACGARFHHRGQRCEKCHAQKGTPRT